MQKSQILKFDDVGSKNFIVLAAVSIMLLLLFGFIFYRVNAGSIIDRPYGNLTAINFSDQIGHDSGLSVSGMLSRPLKQPMSEIQIIGSGLILLSGARIISVVGNNIYVVASWDSINIIWEVRVNSSTGFTINDGKKAALADLRMGDIVTVTGNLIDGKKEPIIEALSIRRK